MEIIAEQPYYKMIREVSSIKQQDIKDKRKIVLFTDKVKTKHREFPLSDVLDMSFRKVGKEGGILYLHTMRGVYSYHVETSPESFITTFKQYIEQNK